MNDNHQDIGLLDNSCYKGKKEKNKPLGHDNSDIYGIVAILIILLFLMAIL
jgi:hypothetical protein